jgi:hypothetical protein
MRQTSTAGPKLHSGRERLLQGVGGSVATPGMSCAMIAIQQAPEWLRPPLEVDSPGDENGGNRGGY